MTDRKIDLPEGVPPLSSYYVYLTGGCNLACKHCYITPTFMPNGGTGGHLDFELFKLAIEEGLPLGLQSVKLTGGEPLLHPDFIRIVDLIRENELNLTIETNGTLITPELANYLKWNSTLSHISVSLDGATRETHDAFRGVKGSFQKAYQGILSLVELDIHPQVIMSIHSGNCDEVESLVRLAESIGSSSVKFNPIQPTGRGGNLAKHKQLQDIHQLIQIGNWVEKDLQKKVSIPLLFGWPMAFQSLRRLTVLEGKCNIFNILGILSTGHLAMCGVGTHLPDLCYGILGQDSVDDIWHHNIKLLELRKKLPLELDGVCGQCIFKENCMGYCVAGNYSSTRRLTTAYWICQSAFDQGIFPLSRLRVVDVN